MKQKLFTLLLAVAAGIGTMFAWDYERVQIGDLYYNLDATNQTAEVKSGSDSGEIIIPSSVTYNSVSYSVTYIGDYAFAGCTGLTSVTIGNRVTSIGLHAFSGCTGLTSIEIPNSVIGIEQGAFENCSSLTSIEIPNSVTYIGWDAFSGCTGLTSVTIPNSVTAIGDHAFHGCTGLTSIEIPNSVTYIGYGAFLECSSLTSIDVASDNSNFCSVDGVLFNKDKTTLIQYPGGKQGAYTIPNSVTSIRSGAFYGCTGLTSVTIPNSVTYIGERAFAGCSGLTSVTNYAATPQIINNSVFLSVNMSACTLYVPKGSLSTYQAADVWKEFGKIIGIDAPQEIHNLSSDHIQSTKLLHDGQIFILRGDKTYTLQGQEVR